MEVATAAVPMEVTTAAVPMEVATPAEEPSKFAELMLFLTAYKDSFAIRCYKDVNGVHWYCAKEFICMVFKHILNPVI
jgi:hypothetical protein